MSHRNSVRFVVINTSPGSTAYWCGHSHFERETAEKCRDAWLRRHEISPSSRSREDYRIARSG